MTGTQMREFRRSVQAVFQDPWSSLNPRMRAAEIIAEPLVIRGGLSKQDITERVDELIVSVGLDKRSMRAFPHEFSGGQRQRIAIARSLSVQPELVVLDEPVSALDVSIRAQLMNLLRELQESTGTAFLLIAHDLATVRYLSSTVAVMYLGVIVEEGTAEEVVESPLHPYTIALVDASRPFSTEDDTSAADEYTDDIEIPSPTRIPSGCRFRTRCPYAFDRCASEEPRLVEKSPGHRVACHLY
jgi:peptide/nickel transport system ATP-binding protein/oligopeptide transport system ATP-binding protein